MHNQKSQTKLTPKPSSQLWWFGFQVGKKTNKKQTNYRQESEFFVQIFDKNMLMLMALEELTDEQALFW